MAAPAGAVLWNRSSSVKPMSWHRIPRRASSAALIVVLGIVSASCGGGGATSAGTPGGNRSDNRSAEGNSGADHVESVGATTTTSRPATGSGRPVTLAFAGDVNFQNRITEVRSSPSTVLAAIAPVLSAADVTMVNLEAALGSGGTPQPKKFTFQVPDQAIDALQAAGVDVVTAANNHGMDFGPAGFRDSLRIKHDRGFPILGIGADDTEATTPWVTEVKGQRVGFLAANDVFDDPLRAAWTAAPGHPGLASIEEAGQVRFAERVRQLRPTVDTLVVFLHYGTETQTCPNQRQKDLVGLLVDAGADIVVGSHPHRLQGVGYRGEQFVAYSLGNFAFQANSPEGAASGVLTVTATGRRIDGYTWTPAVIRGSIPFPLTGSAAVTANATMDRRRDCAGLTEAAATPGPATTAPAPSTAPAEPTRKGSRR